LGLPQVGSKTVKSKVIDIEQLRSFVDAIPNKENVNQKAPAILQSEFSLTPAGTKISGYVSSLCGNVHMTDVRQRVFVFYSLCLVEDLCRQNWIPEVELAVRETESHLSQ